MEWGGARVADNKGVGPVSPSARAAPIRLIVARLHDNRYVMTTASLDLIEVRADAGEGVHPPADAASSMGGDDHVA